MDRRGLRNLKALERLRMRLLRRGLPRLQMTVIVTVTGVVAFLFSFLLLRAGLTSMALRYPLAATLAYLLFLGQLRIWLAAVRRRAERSLDVDVFEPLESFDFSLQRQPGCASRSTQPIPADPPLEYETPPVRPPTSSGPDFDMSGLDLDEVVALLVPIAPVADGCSGRLLRHLHGTDSLRGAHARRRHRCTPVSAVQASVT
jgi:hypothetical protein